LDRAQVAHVLILASWTFQGVELLELVEIYEAPESHVGIVEQLLTDASIPFIREPGVSGYPMVEPFVRLRVPEDRAEEATNLISLGPAMAPPPPAEERELGHTPEMDRPLSIASESPDEARRLADEYLAAHPDDVNAWDCAAGIASDSGDAAAAEAVVRRGLEANPHHPWLRSLLGHYLEMQGHLEDAREVYESLTSANPDAPHGYVGLAKVAIRKNLHDDARPWAERASDRIHPVYQPRSSLDLALVWLEIGDEPPALEILQTNVNWYRKGNIAMLVAVLLEQDPVQSDDVVDEAFDDARRFWEPDRDGDWEDVLESTRRRLEERNYFKKFI
jgi:tetratricopeptide (TPR) repeat protein